VRFKSVSIEEAHLSLKEQEEKLREFKKIIQNQALAADKVRVEQ
jgi:hypothetical protein